MFYMLQNRYQSQNLITVFIIALTADLIIVATGGHGIFSEQRNTFTKFDKFI